ncbi:MAG TPA: hypothetical protein VL098_14820 [Flavipsychrobacter sp.]|nr:hypothetical protein [Flavipsychrobacter sp.]
MKSVLIIAVVFIVSTIACKKQESGICRCSYLSGDKKDYDLSSLPRDQQQDSCGVLDGYAEAFAGDCKLK